MDTENLGPSPEEMGIDNDESPTGSSFSNETGQKEGDLFENFVNTGGLFSKSTEIVNLEREKLFVIAKAGEIEVGKSDVYYRVYFAQALEQESDKIFFQKVAEASTLGDQGVNLRKFGRTTPGWSETEILDFTNEFREDKNEFDLSYALLGLKEEEQHGDRIKGFYLSVIYDPKGDLFFVTPDHKDLPNGNYFTSKPFRHDDDNTEAMEELRLAAEEGRILETIGMKLGVSYSPDREDFIFTMYNKQGDTDYTVTVPLHVNVTEIMEETGALNLLRNPTQPSEGIQGQGIGDTDWRYKSFSELTGVKLTTAKI